MRTDDRLLITEDERNDPSDSAHAIIVNINSENSQLSPPPPYVKTEHHLSWKQACLDELKQAAPNSLRGIAVAGRYLAISLFLAKLDERLLAPNTLICLLESLLVVLGSRTLNPVSTEIGRLNGANEKEAIGPVFRQGLVLAMLVGAPITALYYFANHHILALVGQHPFAVEEAKKYFQAAALGYLALMLFTIEQRFFQGIKFAIATLYSSLFHSALIVGLSYPLMFGKVGAEKLEMAGAGYAFSMATWTTLIIHSIYMLNVKWLKDYKLGEIKHTLEMQKILHLARVGIPAGLQIATENASNIVNSVFLGRVGGLDALSADQIALQVAQIISIANNGLGGAINPCVSTAVGKKEYTNARKFGHVGMLLGLVFPVFAFTLLIGLNKQFTSLFVHTDNEDNREITNLAKHFLLWECLRQLVTGMQVTTSFALQGIKDTKFSMISSIGCSLLVNLGLLFLFADVKKYSLQTIYASKAIGFTATALLNFGRWQLKSHETSDADKEAVKDKTLIQRTSRACRLFTQYKPADATTDEENTTDLSSLYQPSH